MLDIIIHARCESILWYKERKAGIEGMTGFSIPKTYIHVEEIRATRLERSPVAPSAPPLVSMFSITSFVSMFSITSFVSMFSITSFVSMFSITSFV